MSIMRNRTTKKRVLENECNEVHAVPVEQNALVQVAPDLTQSRERTLIEVVPGDVHAAELNS